MSEVKTEVTKSYTQKFGEVSWGDSLGGEKRINSKDLFLRLNPGSNEMRLVTAPYQYLVHKYKKPGDTGFGQKVGCSKIHGSCPLCSAGEKVGKRWFLGVISRKTGTYKILDISYAVFSQIQKLNANSARWGDPSKYDIDIVVDPNGGATSYYTVQPLPKEPLSAADQQIKDNVDLDDLVRRTQPPTPEKLQERIDKINGFVSTTTANTPVVVNQSADSSVSDSDDSDDEFPEYNT